MATDTTKVSEASPDTVSYARALEVALGAAKEAGELLRADFHRPGGARGAGSHAEADTEAETVIRRALDEAFPDYGMRGEELRAQDRRARDTGRHVWLIDPNDGTSAYLKGHRGAAVSIALLRSGEPVLGVVYAHTAPDDAGDLFAWAEGCGPLKRNGEDVAPSAWPTALAPTQTVLVSQSADKNSEANADVVAPARFRALPSIAYRLALVAAGEAVAGVSLNGPQDWDYAAGHALVRGAGGVVVDAHGNPVVYDADGVSHCGNCFGGAPAIVAELAKRDWSPVLRRGASPLQPSSRVPFDLASPVRGEAVSDAGVLSRAQGCLLGQFAGDALGGLVEFESAQRIAMDYPEGLPELVDGGHWGTLGGQPTDDSEMALMLARSLLDKQKFDDDAVAIAHAIATGAKPQEVYEFTCKWAADHPVHTDVRFTLLAAADRLPEDFSRQMGWVRIALQNAFYRLMHAKGFREGVEKTVLSGGDTDTNGAIAGALLGAVYGARAIPAQWRDRVLTCRPIPYLKGVRHPRPKPFWPVDALVLAERLLVAGRAAARSHDSASGEKHSGAR